MCILIVLQDVQNFWLILLVSVPGFSLKKGHHSQIYWSIANKILLIIKVIG